MSAEIDEIAALRESVRRFLQRSYPPERRRQMFADPTGLDVSAWRTIAEELGLLALGIPESYGGIGAPAAASQVVFEELGAALYCGPYFATAGLAVPALIAAADGPAKSEFLPRIADGSLIVALATTEPASGWDLVVAAATAATGSPEGGWRVTGSKVHVVDAVAAGLLLVTARAPQGLALFAVEPGAAGCVVSPQPSLDLTRRLG